ncbi:MAG: 50S ribosomal protein L15 [Myxococcales bacterium]|nr:50S ribosomal protein L15 [Myxococcales bacterium]
MTTNLSNLHPPAGATKNTKRRGRGEASGLGKTAGKGNKGQNARSGGPKGPSFEGGQMPLIRRLPKRGFRNIYRKEYTILHLRELVEKFQAGEVVDPESVQQRQLVKKIAKDGIKILSDGEITMALTVKAHKASKEAVEKIRAAGGTFEQLQ